MVGRRASYAETLRSLPLEQVAEFLDANSNLPGPRANLELLDAAADTLPRELALALIGDSSEYLVCCGVATFGRLALEAPDDTELVAGLTRFAADGRWRVREAAAIAGQRIGDSDPERMRALVADWTASSDPLVVRCGIATISEPRLLRDPATARAALTACERATATLLATPQQQRRRADVRTLRQALGYCWSVAIAAAPEAGLASFAALDTADADVAWVVRENRRKRRLATLLAT